MSTRFYAGPLSSGMGRRWDAWDDLAAPEAGIDAHLQRWRAPLPMPRRGPPLRPAPRPEPGYGIVDPLVPRR